VKKVAPSMINEHNSYKTAILFIPILAFLAGIVVANCVLISLLISLILAALSLIGYIFFKHQFYLSRVCLLCLIFAAGIIHYYRFNHMLPENHVVKYMRHYALDKLDKVDISAVVVTPSVISRPIKTFPYHSDPNLKTRFWIDTQSIRLFGKTLPVTGLLEMSIPGMIDQYQPGMQIHLQGKLLPIHFSPPTLRGLRPFSYYKHNLLFAKVWVDGPQDINIVSRQKFTFPYLIWRLNQWGRYALLGDGLPVGEYTSDLLSAVILGERNTTQNELNQAMIQIGAAHFLAVSGFNIFVFAFAIWCVGSLIGLSRQHAAVLVIVLTILYAAMAGFGPSITRAAIMTVVLCAGLLLNRQTHVLNSIALAAGILLLLNPNQLFQPGFQLSFIATLGLIVLSKPIYFSLFARYSADKINNKDSINSFGIVARWGIDQLKMFIAVSLAAFMASIPLVMIHYHLFSLIAPLGSMLLYLPASLLTLGGFVQLAVSTIYHPLYSYVSNITDSIGILFAELAILLHKIPGTAISVPAPAWWLAIVYFVVLFYPAVKFRKHLLLLVVLIYLSMWLIQSRSTSWVYVSGPGEGTTTLVNTGQGLALIDCGGSHTGQTNDLLQSVACTYLTKPRLAFLTSMNERYFNDAWSMSSLFPSFEFVVSDVFRERSAFYEPAELLIRDETLKKRFRSAGSVFTLGNAQFEILYPPKTEKYSPKLSAESGAILITLSGDRILIATDLTDLACAMILKNNPDLRAEILILRGQISENSLKMMVKQVHIKKIVPQGPFRTSDRRKLEFLAEKYHVKLPEAKFSGGVLINRP
jgi:ComEC/Rec2-related protein